MAVPIAFVVGFILGYRPFSARWPFLIAAAAVVLEVVVNGIRFGFETVVVWAVAVSLLTLATGAVGLRVGTWVRSRRITPTP